MASWTNPWRQNPWFESVAVAQARAKKRLPAPVFAALVAGSERGQTMADNERAFAELGLLPHVVGQQAERLGWKRGVEETAKLMSVIESASFGTVESTAAVLADVFDGCDRLARDVVGSYLAAPVDPRMMGHD